MTVRQKCCESTVSADTLPITRFNLKSKGYVMKKMLVFLLFSLFASIASAQFAGPSATGRTSTVAQVGAARLGSYVTVTGHIVVHQRENYFTFRDATGEIRVEIENSVWQHRQIAPETKVRLLAEVDRGFAGRYLWVKSLEVVE